MDICSYNHDEIVYDSRKCPLCEAIESNIELERNLNKLSEEYDELVHEKNRLQEDFDDLHDEVQNHHPELLI